MEANKREDNGFGVALRNEREYVVKPLYKALARFGYNPRPYKVPRGTARNCGALNGDYHRFMIRSKTRVKHLLEDVELVLPARGLRRA